MTAMCVKKREHVDEFLSHISSINPQIKFAIEIESEVSIVFLDTKTTRQEDGSITVSVLLQESYRYLDFKLHHHPQRKHSVVRTLMARAKSIPSTEKELNHHWKLD